jgi:hypothetical protein
MTQHPGQPEDAQRPDGDDPYASPSSETYGSLPPAGSSTPPPAYGPSGQPGGSPQPYGQPQYGQSQPPYGQPQYGQAPYGQPYGQAPGYSGGYGPPAGPPPPNYLVWAILSTLFCCLPLGVVSIVFAAQVNSKWASGDVAGARDSSAKAKQFALWSALAAVVVIALYVILIVIIGVGSFSTR